ncbi:hypothetical protein ACFLXA_01755 [Chloroflexota bacterium]
MKLAGFIRIGIVFILIILPLFSCLEETSLLPAPTLNSPSSGETDVSTTPDFSWDPVSGANRYWLTVAINESYLPTDPKVTSAPDCVISEGTSSTSYIPGTPLDENATYYWQVQARYLDGSAITQRGEYSSQSCFMTVIDRESKITADQAKITPETDLLPPVLHSDEYEQPVPMPYPVNTAGAEDSAFMMPDGNTLFVWFTPDPGIPAEDQVLDGVTGIYVFQKVDGEWQAPERVILQDCGKASLEGCEFVQGSTIEQGSAMWFCAAREGYAGLHWFTASYIDGNWTNWQNADFNPDYQVGELHITGDGNELYFHSSRAGGKGEYDIWVSRNEDGEWQPPRNIDAVNSTDNEGWPFLTQDGQELWFTRFYMGSPAIFRSKRVNGEWQEPELIISQFAGESSMDEDGNIYFTHHFYKDNVMLEADIYVAMRKQ